MTVKTQQKTILISKEKSYLNYSGSFYLVSPTNAALDSIRLNLWDKASRIE